MANGKLGSAALAAATHTEIYTVPADTVATLNILVTNRGSSSSVVDIAIAASTSPDPEDFIEFAVSLPGGGVLERTAIVAGAGEMVVVRASTEDCSVRVHGFEETQ